MRKPALFSALATCAIGSLALASSPLAQESPPPNVDVPAVDVDIPTVDVDVPADVAPRRYLVTVAEYRLDPPAGPAESGEAVLKRALGGEGSTAVETVRLSVPAGEESSASFSRTAFIQTGNSFAGRGAPARQYQSVDLGTILRAQVLPDGERAAVRLKYESSRLDDPPADEETPPGMAVVKIETFLQAELNRPTLLAGGTAGAAVLTLTVAEL